MECFIDSHLSLERLAAFLDGNLPANEMQEIEALSVNDLLLHDIVQASDRIADALATASDAWETEMIDLDAVELPDVPDVDVETVAVVAVPDELPVEVSVPADDVVLTVATEETSLFEDVEISDSVKPLPNISSGSDVESFDLFSSSPMGSNTEQLEIEE